MAGMKKFNEDERQIAWKKVPWGIWVLEKFDLCCFSPLKSYKALVFLLTYACYTAYHLSRKPFSVVKVALCPVCANCSDICVADNDTTPGWAPFNDENRGQTLLGSMDYSWLFSYAVALYFSGFVAERVNLRWFLTFGMLSSGFSVCLLGLAYFANIHSLAYFIIVQVTGGFLQSSGWPGVLAVMTNWFGKHNRGLIMGVWNSHSSVGNILGTIIPSFWAHCEGEDSWGYSFLLPGIIMMSLSSVIYLFLVTEPTHVGLRPPMQHLEEDLRELITGPSHFQPNGAPASTASTSNEEEPKPINFFRAFLIPGVIEYSAALFFNKLVSYTFLFWLPFYVKVSHPDLSGPQSDWLSTLYDVGGIMGVITAGVVSDFLNARAITCATMLLLAVPMLSVMNFIPSSLAVFMFLLIINGALINGPFGIIITAVASDLGTHPSLKANTNAKATVTAIIDGTGSMGAAFGPLLVGVISDSSSWTAVFYFLMASTLVATMMLSRLVVKEIARLHKRLKQWHIGRASQETVELQRLQPPSDSDP